MKRGGESAAARTAWAAAVVAATAVACGARTGLLVPEEASTGPDGGSIAPDAAEACVGTEIPLATNAPVLYFVLDASGSMAEQGKWTNMLAAIAELIDAVGAQARFGAAVFPEPNAGACTSGVEVMSVRLGDATGAASSAFLAATAFTPVGGTPTAATLRALVPELAAFPQATYAILATDGGPNCNDQLSCDADTCTSNMDGVAGCPVGGPPNCCDPAGGVGGVGCLDGPDAVDAVKALGVAGVETFVMGIPGSAPYAAVLDQLALAGGGARASEPYYYRVDTADTTALAASLAQIAAAATASCTVVLQHVPEDPGDVNVYVGGALVPRDGPNGWVLAGTKLTLEGSTCQALRSGTALTIRVTEGCATVTQ
ncbi:MAG TPA: vWA domain-containing protein [Polyangiaceae bacterium]|jgi:hypothetical protein